MSDVATDMLSLSDAADRCGVSVATIRRRIESGRLPGAKSTSVGWKIPVLELIADGLEPISPMALQHRRSERTSDRISRQDPRVAERNVAQHNFEAVLLGRLVETQALHIQDLRARIADLEARL